jgi:hypothetical protein
MEFNLALKGLRDRCQVIKMMCEGMQTLSSIEKMGDKRSAASYWNMREEWETELHVHCFKDN